jgi:protein-S-isoprenylcysteine O-methyltransferase Ste14
MAPDNAQVRVPPPLFYALAVLGGFLLNRQWPAASALVVSGPYRFTRNPMYVGLAVLTVAVALFLDTWWPVLLLVPVLFTIQRFVIAREEKYLQRRFGAEYTAYAQRVRRWV